MAKFLWTQKQDIGPRPRYRHALAFDAARGRAVLFGGETLDGGQFSDTWEWDGENWTQITDIGPSARGGVSMVYDASLRRTVLFGGRSADGRYLGDTWEWDGESWTQVEDSGPPPRSGHSMAYDAGRSRAVLFGGIGPNGLFADTWEWDGESWTQTAEDGPPARAEAALAYERGQHRSILFGGAGEASLFNDTWGWDGTAWTQVADIGPAPCFSTALAALETRLVLFGGAERAAAPGEEIPLLGRTWEWDGKRWAQRSDFGPGQRSGHAMAYDPANRRLILFGGFTVTAAPDGDPGPRLLGDTWVHVAAAAPAPPPPDEPGGEIEALVLAPASATMANLLAGGIQINCTVRLASAQPVARHLMLNIPFPGVLPVDLLVPPGLQVAARIVAVPPDTGPGTYIFSTNLAGEVRAAAFTLTV